ncbi:MAG: phenylacetate--CoA ligase family protein [Thermoplasmatales archaeon]|nr:phenylacetate--CoA ligase family protein [Thermoplasmatales archaeon]
MGLFRQLYYLHKVRKNQWKSIDELRKIQNKKLRKIVDYAYSHVPFYHDLFKKVKIHPSDVKYVSNLNKIPIVTKQDLKDNFPEKIISNEFDHNKLKIWDTSGSTGLPLKIAYDKKADDFVKAVLLRSYFSIGVRYFDRWCYVSPPEFEKEKGRRYAITQKSRFISPYYIPLYEPIEKKIELLKKFNPRVLESQATDLFLIARYIQENDVKGINPEITVSNGELLDDYMRKYITDVFGVDHFDVYGCMELRRNAWECPQHEGYHMDIDSVVMQFIKDNEEVSAGQEGKITFTGLFNYAMPIIRYDIGDVGVPSKEMCSCGRGLPLMKILEGKLMDFLKTTDGRLLSPHLAKGFLLFVQGVNMFKVIQESKEKVKILIVKNIDYKEETNVTIEKTFKKMLGEDVVVDIEFVDKLKREGRKYKVIESKVTTAKLI